VSDVRVVYVGGIGRSGSTLVDRLLGQVPGCASAGEVVHLWRRGVLENERCGCGEPFDACPFWAGVGERAFGGWGALDVHAVLAMQHRVDRNRYVPWLVAPRTAPPAWRSARDRYAEVLSRVYRAIAEQAGASIVVDSSKHASTAALLRSVDGVDLRLVQLIRDPRGVAYSWSKLVARPDSVGDDSTMARIGSVRVSMRWLAYNLLFQALRLGTPARLLRYEDLVVAPADGLRSILDLAGRRDEPLPFLVDGSATLRMQHTVSGNPLRFTNGTIRIRADREWQSAMPAGDRRLVGAITAPLRAAYGYVGDRNGV